MEKISGPVTVSISDIMNPGSVIFTTTVDFLNGDAASATAYKTALTSSASSIFGSTYAVQVDTSTIKDATVANPSKLIVWALLMLVPVYICLCVDAYVWTFVCQKLVNLQLLCVQKAGLIL